MSLLAPLSKKGLDTIANHKYVGGKYTPLDNLLNPFWYFMTERIPLWVAPNLITIIGLQCNLSAFAQLWFVSPHFDDVTQSIQPRVFFLCAVMGFFYQTLDAMDGKQARRTNSSSPMGQLFDHGCDCINLIGMHALGATCLGLGPCHWTILLLVSIYVPFFVAQWQEYHTGVLPTAVFLGPLAWGVTECQFALMFLSVQTGLKTSKTLFGSPLKYDLNEKLFSMPFVGNHLEHLGFQFPPTASGGPYTDGHWYALCFMIMCFSCTCLAVIQTIPKILRSSGLFGCTFSKLIFELFFTMKNFHLTNVFFREKIFFHNIVLSAFSQFIPIIICTMACLHVPSWVLLKYSKVIVCATGLVYAHLTNQMIVFSMAKESYPLVQRVLMPFVAIIYGLHQMKPGDETADLVCTIAAAIAFTYWFSWAFHACLQISEKLNIKVFSIKVEKEKKIGKEKKKTK